MKKCPHARSSETLERAWGFIFLLFDLGSWFFALDSCLSKAFNYKY